jgi:hypothetical protein
MDMNTFPPPFSALYTKYQNMNMFISSVPYSPATIFLNTGIFFTQTFSKVELVSFCKVIV